MTSFLLPLLQLQKDIEAIVAEDGTTLRDVCNAPLSPQSDICNIQNVWAYWQDEAENLLKGGVNADTKHNDTYLDHFLLCARNPANPSDGLEPPQSCMSAGGIPVQPYFVLGGFQASASEAEGGEEAENGGDPSYERATAVVMTIINDNYDAKSTDPVVQSKLARAKLWEKAFVSFMQNWTANEENTREERASERAGISGSILWQMAALSEVNWSLSIHKCAIG